MGRATAPVDASPCQKCNGTRRMRVTIPYDEARDDDPAYFMSRCDRCDLWGYLDRDSRRRCGACTTQGLPGRQHPAVPHSLSSFVTSAPPCECDCSSSTSPENKSGAST